MGNELGQLYEWSEAGTLDWALAERPFHRFSTACAKLMWRIPRCTQIMRRIISGGRRNHADAPCVFGMERRANGETLLALCNFADSEQKFTASLPKFTILLDSNAAEFGGTGERLPSPARIVCVRLRCRDTVRFCSSCKIEKQPKGFLSAAVYNY